jgi:hypothetical protein
MIVVFSVAMWYFLSTHSSVLVLSTDQSDCNPYTPIYSTNQQSSSNSGNIMNVFVPLYPGQPQSENNHSAVSLITTWTSCSMTVTSTTPVLYTSDGGSEITVTKNFNISTSAFVYPDNWSDGGAPVFNTTSVEITSNGHLTSDGSVVYFARDCYSLSCSVSYAPGSVNSYVPTSAVNPTFLPSGTVYGQIYFGQNSVVASCGAVIFGTPIPFFSIANPIVDSIVDTSIHLLLQI